jgi:hypothetical protein
MKKYIVKYIPVDDEIKSGDKYLHKNGHVQTTSKNLPLTTLKYINENCKKVELFLCSRDIQVGDEIVPILNWETPLVCDPIKVYKEGDKGPIGEPYQIWNERLGFSYMKILGRLSPHATWVKENDEIDEIMYECMHVDAFGESYWYDLTEQEFTTRDMKSYPTNKYRLTNNRGHWLMYIKVKGPCGHYH